MVYSLFLILVQMWTKYSDPQCIQINLNNAFKSATKCYLTFHNMTKVINGLHVSHIKTIMWNNCMWFISSFSPDAQTCLCKTKIKCMLNVRYSITITFPQLFTSLIAQNKGVVRLEMSWNHDRECLQEG